jgi:hypothetical protein
MLALIDVARTSISRRLYRRTPLDYSCLEIAGLDGIRSCTPMFLLIVWFQRERCKALLPVAIMGHVLYSPWRSHRRRWYESQVLRTSNGGMSLGGDGELAWWFVNRSSGMGKCWWQHRRSSKSYLNQRFVTSNVLIEGLVLWAWTFYKVKTYVLCSDDDDTCVLFPSSRCHYWWCWTSGAIMVVFVTFL